MPIPIFRIFDLAVAEQFYCGFLGFTKDWEHRFEEDFPCYMQISRAGCILHLSEHYGDSTPGGAIRIEVSDINSLHKELLDQKYKYARPGIETQEWGAREVRISDPFGNRIVFYEQV